MFSYNLMILWKVWIYWHDVHKFANIIDKGFISSQQATNVETKYSNNFRDQFSGSSITIVISINFLLIIYSR
jgi:hypothetical protein